MPRLIKFALIIGGFFAIVVTWLSYDPVVFYGRVVDAGGNPVGGARVQLSVAWQSRLAISLWDKRGNTRQVAYLTQADGCFSVRAPTEVLSVSYVTKDNLSWQYDKPSIREYILHRKGDSRFWYTPDPKNPVTFVITPKR